VKLEKLACEAIELLKKSGENGITNARLAISLKVPKRRIYDVVAILKAAQLITTFRNKEGTRLFWLDASSEIGRNERKKIRANKIKVCTSGYFTSVSNRGTEVIVESTSPSISIEQA
jgi:NMD protein affecting ribosome stability and mRNA decay